MPELFHDTGSAALFRDAKMNKVNLFESPRLFCDVYCLEPGQAQKDHSHDRNDKVYHVLTGTCRVRIGDESRRLSEGQIAIAPAGVIHGVHNDSDCRTSLLVVMAPHPTLST